MGIACACAQAQNTTAAVQPADPLPVEPKYERIRHEDSGSRIEEIRIGGQTQSITVQSKLGGQPYEVIPAGSSRDLRSNHRSGTETGGRTLWRIGDF
jgi:hypothetical protein